jgi:hypothetical protein
MYLVASEGELRQNREASPPVDIVGQPWAEVVAQMGRKHRMPKACRRMEHLRAGAGIHGEVGDAMRCDETEVYYAQ